MMRVSNTSLGPAEMESSKPPPSRGFVNTITGLFKPSAALPDASLVQGQLHAAKSEIDKLAALVAADAYGTRDGSFSGTGSPFGNDLIKSASVAEVEASQDLVSTQNALRDVQQQLVDREREAEILEAEVAELTRFLDSLVSGPASSDKVAEMLDRELKAARKRVNKLSRDCQVLQDMLYAKSMEMARAGEELVELRDLQARAQKQISALKILFSEKVRESANLMRGLELANGMLLAVKGELGEVQEVRVALEEALEEKDRLNEALAGRVQELEAKVAELTKGGTVSEDAVAALQQQLGSKSDTLKAALAELETANGHLEVMSKSSGIKDDTIAHLTRQVRALEAQVHAGAQQVQAALAQAEAARAAAEQAPEPSPEGGAASSRAAERQLKSKHVAEVQKLKDEVKERDARIKDAQTMAIRAESQLSGLKTVLATKTSQCHRMESEVRTLELKLREQQRGLAQENEALRSTLSDAQEKIKVLRGRISLQEEVHAGVQQQLEASRSHMTELLEGLAVETDTLQGGGQGLQHAAYGSLSLHGRTTSRQGGGAMLMAGAPGVLPDTLALAQQGSLMLDIRRSRSTSQALEMTAALGLPPAPPGAVRPPSALGPYRRGTRDASPGSSGGSGPGPSIPLHIQAQLDSAKRLLNRMGTAPDRHSSVKLAPEGAAAAGAGAAGGEGQAAADAAVHLRRGRHTTSELPSHSKAKEEDDSTGGSSSSSTDASGQQQAEGPGRSSSGMCSPRKGPAPERLGSGDFERSKRHTVAIIPDLETVQEVGCSRGSRGSSHGSEYAVPHAEGEAEELI